MFNTDYDINQYANVMDIQTFVYEHRNDINNKFAIVELFNAKSKHLGDGSENLDGILLQSFKDLITPTPRNILKNIPIPIVHIYIVTFQGATGVNQTVKVTKKL
jgi:hypothetical protein